MGAARRGAGHVLDVGMRTRGSVNRTLCKVRLRSPAGFSTLAARSRAVGLVEIRSPDPSCQPPKAAAANSQRARLAGADFAKCASGALPGSPPWRPAAEPWAWWRFAPRSQAASLRRERQPIPKGPDLLARTLQSARFLARPPGSEGVRERRTPWDFASFVETVLASSAPLI
jgi:hypothetical protein